MHGNRAAVTAEIRRVDSALTAEIRRVDDKLTAEIRRVVEKLTWALDLRERIATLEGKLAGPQRS
jgi:hypothetical protein